MKAPDLFGLVIRVCGFLAIASGVRVAWLAIQTLPNALWGEVPIRTVTAMLSSAVAALGLGAVCFGWPDWLVALSYRNSPPDVQLQGRASISPRDIFGLIVRAAGMAVFLYGGYYLIYGLADAVGLLKETSPGAMRSYLVFGVPATLAGLAMVGGAQVTDTFSYRLASGLPRPPVMISPCDIFGLIARAVGIAVFLYGGNYLIYGLAETFGLLREDSPGEVRYYLVAGIPATLAGLVMVGTAQVVVAFSYRFTDGPSPSHPNASN
jgi:hypothetical protein